MITENSLTSVWCRAVIIRKTHYHRISFVPFWKCCSRIYVIFMLREKIYSFQFGQRYVRFTSHIFLNTFLALLESSCIRIDSCAYFKLFSDRRNFSSKSLFCKKKKKGIISSKSRSFFSFFFYYNHRSSSFDRILIRIISYSCGKWRKSESISKKFCRNKNLLENLINWWLKTFLYFSYNNQCIYNMYIFSWL